MNIDIKNLTPEQILEKLIELNGKATKVLKEPLITLEEYNELSIFDEGWSPSDEADTTGIGTSFEKISKYHSDRINERWYGTIAFFGGIKRVEQRKENQAFSLTAITASPDIIVDYSSIKKVAQIDNGTNTILVKEYNFDEAKAENNKDTIEIFADYELSIDEATGKQKITVIDLTDEQINYIAENITINDTKYELISGSYINFIDLADVSYIGNANGVSLLTEDDIDIIKKALARAIDVDRYVKRPKFLDLAIPNLNFSGTNDWGLQTQQFNTAMSYSEDIQKLINNSSLRAIAKNKEAITEVWLKVIGASNILFYNKGEVDTFITEIWNAINTNKASIEKIKELIENVIIGKSSTNTIGVSDVATETLQPFVLEQTQQDVNRQVVEALKINNTEINQAKTEISSKVNKDGDTMNGVLYGSGTIEPTSFQNRTQIQTMILNSIPVSSRETITNQDDNIVSQIAKRTEIFTLGTNFPSNLAYIQLGDKANFVSPGGDKFSTNTGNDIGSFNLLIGGELFDGVSGVNTSYIKRTFTQSKEQWGIEQTATINYFTYRTDDTIEKSFTITLTGVVIDGKLNLGETAYVKVIPYNSQGKPQAPTFDGSVLLNDTSTTFDNQNLRVYLEKSQYVNYDSSTAPLIPTFKDGVIVGDVNWSDKSDKTYVDTELDKKVDETFETDTHISTIGRDGNNLKYTIKSKNTGTSLGVVQGVDNGSGVPFYHLTKYDVDGTPSPFIAKDSYDATTKKYVDDAINTQIYEAYQKETVLYENSAGSLTATLSDSYKNYRYIQIEYLWDGDKYIGVPTTTEYVSDFYNGQMNMLVKKESNKYDQIISTTFTNTTTITADHTITKVIGIGKPNTPTRELKPTSNKQIK